MRNHPQIPHLKISLGGKFTYKEKPLAVRAHKSHGKTIPTVTIKRTVRSAAKLVLETYVRKPTDGQRHYAAQKYGQGLNLGNLYWRSARKLNTKQAQRVLKEKGLHGGTLQSIANDFGVSGMTIHRTLKRVQL